MVDGAINAIGIVKQQTSRLVNPYNNELRESLQKRTRGKGRGRGVGLADKISINMCGGN
jgi:hypothetical protein